MLILFKILISTALALPVAPNVIYGDDDRVEYFTLSAANQKLADATAVLVQAKKLSSEGDTTYFLKTLPYSADAGLCRDEVFGEQLTVGFCSGFLIAPDIMVTAGHCIHDAGECAQTRFVFGRALKHPGERLDQAPTDQVYSCQTLMAQHHDQKGADYGVVRLDRSVSGIEPLRLRRSGQAVSGDPVAVIGYPYGLPLKYAAGAQVRRTETEYFIGNLDIFAGSSGSPVISTQTGLVEGILVRGVANDYVYDPALRCHHSLRYPNDGGNGDDVTFINQIFPYLP